MSVPQKQEKATNLSKNGILSFISCACKVMCLLASPRLFLQKLVARKC